MMPVSEARKRANAKYEAKTYTPLQIKPKITEADFIKKSAENRGESLTRYLVKCAELRESSSKSKVEIDLDALFADCDEASPESCSKVEG